MSKKLTEDERAEQVVGKIADSVLELGMSREEAAIEFTRRFFDECSPDDGTRETMLELAEDFALRLVEISDKESLH